MVPAAGGLELGEHPLEGGLAEATEGSRGQLEPLVGAGQVPLTLELALQVAQPLQVGHRVAAEPLLQQVDVDVIEGRPGAVLGQLLAQRLQVGELGDRLDGLAVPEGLATLPHPGRRGTIQSGSQRAQVVRQLSHLRGQVGIGQRLLHQLGELLALLGAERVHHPLGGGLPTGQRVDQLLDGLRLLREELAVLVHELGERVGGVLVAGVLGQQRVEVGQHVLDLLHRLGVLALQRLLHAGELGVQHLPLQHLGDGLVRLPGLVGAPLVVTQRPDGAGDVVGDGLQLQLRQPVLVAVHPGQLLPLGGQRLVEGGPDLVQGAPEVAALASGGAQLAESLGELVQTTPTVQPTLHQLPQRVPDGAGGQHVLADLVQGRAEVVRRRERVASAPPGPVAEPAVRVAALVPFGAHGRRLTGRRRRSGRRRRPCRSDGSGADPPARTPPRPRPRRDWPSRRTRGGRGPWPDR